MGILFTSFHVFFFQLIFVLPARYVHMRNVSGKSKQMQVVYTVNLSEYFLLCICSCLIVCSEIPFSESLCFIGTSQFISSVHDLTRFFLICIFTELNLQTHLRPIIVLCIRFYNPALAIICLTAIRFSIIDVFELS